MANRLSRDEIDQALVRIRAEYDHYCVHYFKPQAARNKFEERYAEALRQRIDLTNFLGAEIQVIKTLLDRAETEAATPKPLVIKKAKPRSYADRVIEQLQARIKDYPSLGLPDHPEKSLDVDKLYGTLRWFRKEIWEHVYPLLLAKGASPELFSIDTELGQLTFQGENWPKEVEAYWAFLEAQVESSQIARSQNRCLLQGGQLITRIRRLADGHLSGDQWSPSERDTLTKMRTFCDRVLSDFRLKDLSSRA